MPDSIIDNLILNQRCRLFHESIENNPEGYLSNRITNQDRHSAEYNLKREVRNKSINGIPLIPQLFL
jgi:hypothetical protein